MKFDIGKRNHIAFVLIGLFASVVYYLPYIKGSNPELKFYGDLYMLYYPQFVEGFNRYVQGAISGIDFFTGNGASSYSLRANIPVFYPVYLVFYFIIDLTTGNVGGNEMILVFVLHSFICYLFTYLVCIKYFNLRGTTSLIVSLGYTFAVTKWIGLTPFFYIPSLFPSLLFLGLYSANSNSFTKSFLCSIGVYFAFMAGYAPLAMHSVLLSIIISIITLGYSNNKKAWQRPPVKVFILLLLPTLIATIAAAPYYLGMYFYKQLTSGLPSYSWYATSEFHYTWADFVSMLSFGFPPDVNPVETPHISFGFVIVFVLFVAAFNLKNLKPVSANGNFLIAIGLIVTVHLFLMTGSETGLPSLFYYLVPFLGEMHLYGRYFIVASFCIFLLAAFVMQSMQEAAKSSDIDIIRPLATFVMFVTVLAFLRGINQPYQDRVLFETSLVVLLAFVWHRRIFTNVTTIVACLIFFNQYSMFAVTLSNYNLEFPPVHENSFAYDKVRVGNLKKFINDNSDKDLIKYVDLTTSIEKFGGPPLNLPYLLDRKIPLSNYLGYELHNSLEVHFMNQGFSYFGKFNEDWLRFTDADFVIFDDSSKEKNLDWFHRHIDNMGPRLDLGYGYKIAKIRRDHHAHGFNNGIFRVECAERPLEGSFTSNFSTFASLEYECEKPSRARLQLFPNINMKLRVNGDYVDLSKDMSNGTILELPSGKNVLSYSFSNKWIYLFNITGWTYFGLYIIFLFINIVESLRLKKFPIR